MDRQKGKKRYYATYVKSVGFPNTALICCISRCKNPAAIWLERPEADAYLNGERIFPRPINFTKMRADERGINI